MFGKQCGRRGSESVSTASKEVEMFSAKPHKKFRKKGVIIAAGVAAALSVSADHYMSIRKFSQASALLKERIEETGAESLVSKKVEIYQAEADSYLKNGDCLAAVQTLSDGGQAVGEKYCG